MGLCLHAYACIHAYIHACIHTYVRVCAQLSMYIHTYTCECHQFHLHTHVHHMCGCLDVQWLCLGSGVTYVHTYVAAYISIYAYVHLYKTSYPESTKCLLHRSPLFLGEARVGSAAQPRAVRSPHGAPRAPVFTLTRPHVRQRWWPEGAS